MMNHVLRFVIGLIFCVSIAPLSDAARTVSGNERGLYYALPYQCNGNYSCTDWSGIGAYLGQFNSQSYFNSMDSASLKIGHGRLQHFADFDDWTEALFPYSQLLQYDNSEVAAGRPSLFVTATYQGVKRPVLWTWYGVTSYPYNSPGRPINLKDSRFVSFFVNQYIQPWMQKINRPNVMVLLDNCTFNYGLYGVKDNAGNFISGVTWDYPYAQNQTDFLNSINNFVVQVHQMNPNIKMICNTDAGAPQSDFLASFQNLDGISIESMEYYYQGGDNWWRSQFFNQYTNAAWIGNAGKIGLMIWQMANDTSTAAVRRAYMHYLMVRGDNFFFAPKIGNNEMATSYYLNMKNAIGLPIAPTVVAQEPGRTQGYAVYSRQTSGGIAYLNWSGVTKTITLPAGAQYVNSSGQPVTQISIPDMAGDYVLYAGGALSLTGNQSPVVTITSPANGANFTMPANVTIAANAYDPDGSIARVEFWQGPNKLGEVYSAPYTWTMYNVPAGSYSGTYGITVKAVDNSGAVSTSGTVSITVGSTANQLPVVSLTTPSNGATFAAPATFTVTASAYDPDGSIARVEFWQGANKLGEDYAAPYTWTVTNAPAFNYTGTYAFTAKAFDNLGAATTSSPVSVSVGATGNQPPVVTLTAPADGATYKAPATFTMTASAYDPDGSIARVEFWQGPNKLGEDYAAPYTWTVTNAPAFTYTGTYGLFVRAVDNNGAITTSNVVGITVR